jgi:glycosyltransferase
VRFTLITVVKDRVEVVRDALESIYQQDFTDFEHIIIDGNSTDGTFEIVQQAIKNNVNQTRLIQREDGGMYPALNYALKQASGDIIGLLHSDDILASPNVLSKINNEFLQNDVDAVYGNLDYVSNDAFRRLLRRWKSSTFSVDSLKTGWMPPHPTLYLKRNIYDQLGGFDASYKISADYDFMLRCFLMPRFSSKYLDETIVIMRAGGISNRSILSIIKKMLEDKKIMKRRGIGGFYTLILKGLLKINQLYLR